MALPQKHGRSKNHHRGHRGNQQTLQDPEKGGKAEVPAGCGLGQERRRGSPDELGLGLDVPHAIPGQGLVGAVEERPQETARHAHHDEEGQVNRRPQVAALVSVGTLVKQKNPSGAL